ILFSTESRRAHGWRGGEGIRFASGAGAWERIRSSTGGGAGDRDDQHGIGLDVGRAGRMLVQAGRLGAIVSCPLGSLSAASQSSPSTAPNRGGRMSAPTPLLWLLVCANDPRHRYSPHLSRLPGATPRSRD